MRPANGPPRRACPCEPTEHRTPPPRHPPAIQAIDAHRERAEALGISRTEPLLLDAVVRQLAIIGEAASRLPVVVQDRHPEILGRGVKGMRLLLDHEYHRTDRVLVLRTVEQDLPILERAVHDELDA